VKVDLVGAVEACYQPAPSDDAWVAGVLAATRPILDASHGVTAMFFDVSDPARPRAWCPHVCALGAPDGWNEAEWSARMRSGMLGMFSAMTAEMIDHVYRHPKTGVTASQAIGRRAWLARPERQRWTIPLGVHDYIRVVCSDATQRGCVLMSSLASVTAVPRRKTIQLRRLSVHVAAGLRLRRQLDGRPGLESAEAILEPDGRLAHAESAAAKPAAARAALRDHAAAIDRARGQLRRADPDAALELWEGLAAGRWSLVDQFDSDGRRYLVAHRNDPAVASPSRLAPRERQVARYLAMGCSNKHIAYELGLSESTVATHLDAAMTKMGVRSRAALARLLSVLLARG
jgi:DNA-binding CsgD family transcriptional regulator